MKKNLSSAAVEAISAQVANSINSIKKTKEDAKSKTTKKEAKKAELPASKKEATIKEVTKQQKASIAEEVISKRDVKYIYPADCTDSISKKKWRQEQRSEYRKLEREVYKFKDQNTKEAKAALKKFEDFKKTILKPGQVI